MNLDEFKAAESDVAAFYANHPEDVGPRSQARPRTKRVSAPLPRHGEGERFIRGPIPLEWMKLASRCGNRADAVAVLLWYAAGLQRTNPVKLSKSILAELRVHPKTAKRVLLRMADLGLLHVEFHRGRSPVVTLRSPVPK